MEIAAHSFRTYKVDDVGHTDGDRRRDRRGCAEGKRAHRSGHHFGRLLVHDHCGRRAGELGQHHEDDAGDLRLCMQGGGINKFETHCATIALFEVNKLQLVESSKWYMLKACHKRMSVRPLFARQVSPTKTVFRETIGLSFYTLFRKCQHIIGFASPTCSVSCT